MVQSLTDMDKQMMKEAENGDKLWKIDPYEGKLKKERYEIKTNEDIEMVLAQSLIHVKEDDADLNRLPMLGLLNTLKKELDKKYKLDTLKQLQAIDKLTIKTD